jgi:hypothetical protein
MVNSMANTLGLAMLFSINWAGLLTVTRSGFTTTAAINFTDVFDHPNLHRHDVQLLAGFFADGVFTATTGASQFMFGQFVDDFDTWQVGRQRLAFATEGSGRNHFLLALMRF